MSIGPIKPVLSVVLGVLVAGALLLSGEQADAAKDSKKKGRDKAPAAASSQAAQRAPAPPPPPTVQPTASAYPSSGLICLYGKVTDEATGQERCQAPEELNPPRLVQVDTRALAEQLGMVGSTTDPQASKPEPEPTDPPSSVEPEKPPRTGDSSEGREGREGRGGSSGGYKARVVRMSYENGSVGGAERALKKKADEMAQCVADNGGLRVDSARLKLMFLVRSSGKAEGMVVSSARNVPQPIVRCIRKIIEHENVGRPSTDPVGVKVLIELEGKD